MMLASSDTEQVKTGLQRACEILESGQAFINYDFLKMSLAAHLKSPELRVRRWAYKLVALLKDPEYLGQLEAALLGFENDPENRGWASAAFSGLADEGRKARLITRLNDYRGTSLELAARLYARGEPARDDLDLSVWEREPLARKWLCLLCGYARDAPRTIDQRFGDLDLVRNSIGDDDAEVVEYSIWAEHRHPDGSYRHLLRRPDELLAFPNVRRWVYRLLTKDARAARSNLDLLIETMNAARETSDVAREGLALGLAKLHVNELRNDTIDWFSNEASPRVRLALVDHIALLANAHDDALARDVLKAAYWDGPAHLLGAKIRSVAKPDWGLSQSGLAAPAPRLLEPPAKAGACGRAFEADGPGEQLALAAATIGVSGSSPGAPSTEMAAAAPQGDWRRGYYWGVFWKRGLALFLDYLLSGVVTVAVLLAVDGSTDNSDNSGSPGAIVVFLVFFYGACPYFESKWGATPGKMIIGLQITDKDGDRLSFRRAFVRNFFRSISVYLYCFIIPAIYQFSRFKQTRKLFHDEWSHTVIGERLRKPKANPAAVPAE